LRYFKARKRGNIFANDKKTLPKQQLNAIIKTINAETKIIREYKHTFVFDFPAFCYLGYPKEMKEQWNLVREAQIATHEENTNIKTLEINGKKTEYFDGWKYSINTDKTDDIIGLEKMLFRKPAAMYLIWKVSGDFFLNYVKCNTWHFLFGKKIK
jgi:hypothetical protein